MLENIDLEIGEIAPEKPFEEDFAVPTCTSTYSCKTSKTCIAGN